MSSHKIELSKLNEQFNQMNLGNVASLARVETDWEPMVLEDDIPGLKRAAVMVMYSQLHNENYTKDIETLCRDFGITNEQLKNKMNEKFFRGSRIRQAIFVDIIHVIADMVMENSACKNRFIEIYDKKYGEKWNKIVPLVESLGNGAGAERVYMDYENLFNTKIRSAASSYYTTFRILESDKIPLDLKRAYLRLLRAEVGRYQQSVINNMGLEKISFKDETQDIFETDHYKRFKKRSLKRLEELVGSDVITYIEKFTCYLQGTRREINQGGYSFLEILRKKNGDIIWLYDLIEKQSNGGLGYVPDIEAVIDSYYRGRVRAVYYEMTYNTGKNFTPLDLSRECSLPPEVELQSIVELFYTDIALELMNRKRIELYDLFSLDDSGKSNEFRENSIKALEAEKKAIEEEKENEIKKKDSIIADLKKELAEKKEAVKQEEALKKQNLEICKLRKELEKKNNEAKLLKEKLKMQNELLEAMKEEEEAEEEDCAYNLEFLKSKKFLFLGYSEEALPELKKIFPDSVFISKQNELTVNYKADAIVYMTRWLGHGLFYKSKSDERFKGMKTIYSNRKNVEQILGEIYRAYKTGKSLP